LGDAVLQVQAGGLAPRAAPIDVDDADAQASGCLPLVAADRARPADRRRGRQDECEERQATFQAAPSYPDRADPAHLTRRGGSVISPGACRSVRSTRKSSSSRTSSWTSGPAPLTRWGPG